MHIHHVVCTAVVSALLFLSSAPHAAAHTQLRSAVPPAGGTVSSAPSEVLLNFTEPLEPTFSAVEVTDANGMRVDQGKAQISGSTMRVGLKALAPGSYHVRWHVLSVDTHKTEGSFTFHVGGR